MPPRQDICAKLAWQSEATVKLDMEDIDKNAAPAEIEDTFSLKEFLTKCLSQWKWFAISVFLFLCIGGMYILRKQPVYSRSMSVLIKDQDGGGGIGDVSNAFSSLGLVSSNTNVNNELISLSSPAVMYEVVQRLKLDMNYVKKGTFHGTTLYGTAQPFNVLMADIDEQQGAGFRADYAPNGTVRLYKFWKSTPDGIEKYEDEVTGRVDGKTLRTPIGRVVFMANSEYQTPKGEKPEACTIYVSKSGLQNTVELYSSMLKGDLTSKDADVIDLSIKDVSVQRAVDILNNVIAIYNENWVADKNKIAVATSSFIDERLRIIQQELGVVDNDIYAYKSEHLIPDLKASAQLALTQGAKMDEELLALTNEYDMVNFIKDYITNPSNENNVIPVISGVGNSQIEQSIMSYNNLLLNRNNIAASTSESNPIVLDYDAQLRGLRESITKGVTTQSKSLANNIRKLQGEIGTNKSQLASGPTQAKHLLSIERQQKVKESLYLFLLQKREENELNQTFTAYNTRIITPPMGSIEPVAPKKPMILGVCFLLGLCLPGLCIYINEATNTKVRSRKDLDKMSVPFAGEIPLVGGKTGRIRQLLNKRKKDENEREVATMVVKEGSRNASSESFRIVRGNLDFMMRNTDGSDIIMVTSFNPGSGKSFVSINLAVSFALKGKKVLVIDGDLRHGSMSQFVGMPPKGIGNYLTGNTDDWRSLIIPMKDQKNLYVFPIGHRPPNPAELLDNGKLGSLLKELQQEFDYILIDCPPVDVVVDTQIIERYTDRTLFVVRAGLLEKKFVADIDELYKNKRFKQMSIVLNGTTDSKNGRYGYGSYKYYRDHE